MIVFDLCCRAGGHLFEGWFGSSEDFAAQQARGLVTCPVCGSAEVAKAVMAPNVARKGNQISAVRPEAALAAMNAPLPLPPEAAEVLRAIAAVQAEALKASHWVGKDFAEQARAMHYGEAEMGAIHGQASPEEARGLIEEGVEIAPILFPVVPPEQAN